MGCIKLRSVTGMEIVSPRFEETTMEALRSPGVRGVVVEYVTVWLWPGLPSGRSGNKIRESVIGVR